MNVDRNEIKRQLVLHVPYIVFGLFCTNLGEGWRMAEGADNPERILSFMTTLPAALSVPLPSFHPFDLMIGAAVAAVFALIIQVKRMDAKKYRQGVEYGSARWSA